ncbi:hypothetical protein [Variovorax sp. RCC_210]|uniref:hypothetical protein n=1 Tax=Variovorax sp. RCC_210 TaxID=3239217 RepID=UPI003523C84E
MAASAASLACVWLMRKGAATTAARTLGTVAFGRIRRKGSYIPVQLPALALQASFHAFHPSMKERT